MVKYIRKVEYERRARDFGRYVPFHHEERVLFQHGLDRVDRDEGGGVAIGPKEVVSRGVDTRKQYGRRKIRALFAKEKRRTICHTDGGWGRDIDPSDTTETLRYVRKLEKSEDINNMIEHWRNMMEERTITQEMAPLEYMYDLSTPTYLESTVLKASVVETFEEPSATGIPLRHICWLGPGHIVGAYAGVVYDRGDGKPNHCYVWDVESSSRPIATLYPPAGTLYIDCNPGNSEILISGHTSGELCLWDLRCGPKPVKVTGGHHYHELHPVVSTATMGTARRDVNPRSPKETLRSEFKLVGSKAALKSPIKMKSSIKKKSTDKMKSFMKIRDLEDTSSASSVRVYRDRNIFCEGRLVRGNNTNVPVRTVRWNLSEYEVMSGDNEGRVRWWDTRNFSSPIDTLSISSLNIESGTLLSKPPGISALDIHAEDPNIFRVGTDSGHVLLGIRTANTLPDQLRVTWKCPAFTGPVKCLDRHEGNSDIVLAAGDYHMRLFSDEVPGNSIVSLVPAQAMYTSAVWCPTHPAVVHASRQDGMVETWNLLASVTKPIYTLKVCDEKIMCVRSRQEGDLLAVGSCAGILRLVRYTDNIYTPREDDKALATDLFSQEVTCTRFLLDHTSLPCLRDTKLIRPTPLPNRLYSFVRSKRVCPGKDGKSLSSTKNVCKKFRKPYNRCRKTYSKQIHLPYKDKTSKLERRTLLKCLKKNKGVCHLKIIKPKRNWKRIYLKKWRRKKSRFNVKNGKLIQKTGNTSEETLNARNVLGQHPLSPKGANEAKPQTIQAEQIEIQSLTTKPGAMLDSKATKKPKASALPKPQNKRSQNMAKSSTKNEDKLVDLSATDSFVTESKTDIMVSQLFGILSKPLTAKKSEKEKPFPTPPPPTPQDYETSSSGGEYPFDEVKIMQMVEKIKILQKEAKAAKSSPWTQKGRKMISRKLIPIDLEFQTQLVKETKKESRKIMKEHRMNMLAKFGIVPKWIVRKSNYDRGGSTENENLENIELYDSSVSTQCSSEASLRLLNVDREDLMQASNEKKKRRRKKKHLGHRMRRSTSLRLKSKRESPTTKSSRVAKKSSGTSQKSSRPGAKRSTQRRGLRGQTLSASKSSPNNQSARNSGKSKTPSKFMSLAQKKSALSPRKSIPKTRKCVSSHTSSTDCSSCDSSDSILRVIYNPLKTIYNTSTQSSSRSPQTLAAQRERNLPQNFRTKSISTSPRTSRPKTRGKRTKNGARKSVRKNSSESKVKTGRKSVRKSSGKSKVKTVRKSVRKSSGRSKVKTMRKSVRKSSGRSKVKTVRKSTFKSSREAITKTLRSVASKSPRKESTLKTPERSLAPSVRTVRAYCDQKPWNWHGPEN